jgi:hypothetical protein
VTYAVPTGGNTAAISVTLPWSYSFTGVETEGSYQGTAVYLSAYNDSSTGSVTVTILQNGRVYEQSWETWISGQPAVTIVGNF